MNRAVAHPDFSEPLHPPGGMMIWIFIFMELLAFGLAKFFLIFFDFMEMKHAHRLWQVAMTLFTLVLFGAISFSL